MDIFDTKMTAIADEVRRLTETEGSMSLDDMANGLSSVEVGGGGSESGSGSIKTCTLIIDSSSVGFPINNYYATVVNDGAICAQYRLNVGTKQISIDNVVCGSAFTVTLAGNAIPNPNGAEYLYAGVYEITASSGETATISYIGL